MPRKHRKNVGLIGLGIIGTRAAAGLRAAGYHVYVWNRTPKPAPNFLGSPAEIAQVCEIIQIFVSDARALMEVLEAMKADLTSNHVIICNATIGPEATIEASKFVQANGARFLDAPFTGSKLAAERRQLVYYIGGDDTTFLRVKPVLEATSKAIVRIGGIGDAAVVKVATNLISAVSIQALAEALAIVRKAGLPADALAAALEQNAARSGAMDLKLPKMLTGDYEPHFSLKHMYKDVQLGLQMAKGMELETPAVTTTANVMSSGIKRGWGEDDFASVFRVYEEEEDEEKEKQPTLSLKKPGEEEPKIAAKEGKAPATFPAPPPPPVLAAGAAAAVATPVAAGAAATTASTEGAPESSEAVPEPVKESGTSRSALEGMPGEELPEKITEEEVPEENEENTQERPSHFFAKIFGEESDKP